MLSVVLNERLFQALIIACFLLPVCLTYAYEASVSLKIWLTVQELPPPPHVDSDASDSSKLHKDLDNRIRGHANRDTFIYLWSLLPLIFTPLAGLIKEEPQSVVDRRTRLLLFFPMVYISAKMMDTLAARDLELDEVYAIRTSDGLPFLTLRGRRKLGFRFPVFSLPYGTLAASYILYMQGMASSYLSFHFFLFFFVVIGHEQVTIHRFRGRIRFGFLFALVAIFNVGLAFISREHSSDKVIADPDGEERRRVAWVNLLLSCLFSYLPFEFIALCYRFDYSRAKARNQVSTRSLGVDLSDTKKASIQSLFDVQLPRGSEEYYGLRLPSLRSSAISATADPNFPKPYYITAWSSISLSALLVFVLSSDTVGLNFTGSATFDAVGLHLMPLALPLMYALVLLRAASRGELRLLWEYEERWQSSSVRKHNEPHTSKDGKKPVSQDFPGNESTHESNGVVEELKINIAT